MSKYDFIYKKAEKELSANDLAIRKAKNYKRSNPTKGLGLSNKGLREIPKEIKEMSVWD